MKRIAVGMTQSLHRVLAFATLPFLMAACTSVDSSNRGGLIPGAALQISPGTSISLVPTGRICFGVSILWPDGSSTAAPVGSVHVVSDSPEVVRAADARDCVLGGVVGVSTGTTALTVTVTTPDGYVEGRVDSVVRDGEVAIEIQDVIVPPGRTIPIDVRATAHVRGEALLDVAFAPSLLELEVADALVAHVTRGSAPGWPHSFAEYPNSFEIMALFRGETTMRVRYAGRVVDTVHVTVPGRATRYGSGSTDAAARGRHGLPLPAAPLPAR